MKYLVVGANGQLGQELVHMLDNKGLDFVAFDSKSLDITNRDLVQKVWISHCKWHVMQLRMG